MSESYSFFAKFYSVFVCVLLLKSSFSLRLCVFRAFAFNFPLRLMNKIPSVKSVVEIFLPFLCVLRVSLREIFF